jgi:hypothetical protein
MNTDKYRRVTVVLGLQESRWLKRLSQGSGLSQSALVREFLAPPLEGLGPILDAADAGDPAALRQAFDSLRRQVDSQYHDFQREASRI